MFVRQSPVVVQVQLIHLQKKLKPKSLQTKGFLPKKKEILKVLEKENPGVQARSAAMCLHAQFLGIVRALQQVVQGPDVLCLSGLELSAQITQAKLWSLNMLMFDLQRKSVAHRFTKQTLEHDEQVVSSCLISFIYHYLHVSRLAKNVAIIMLRQSVMRSFHCNSNPFHH